MLDRKLGSAVPPHSWLRGRLDGIDGRNRDNSFVRGVNVKKDSCGMEPKPALRQKRVAAR